MKINRKACWFIRHFLTSPQQLPGHTCACEPVVKKEIMNCAHSWSEVAGTWGSHCLWGNLTAQVSLTGASHLLNHLVRGRVTGKCCSVSGWVDEGPLCLMLFFSATVNAYFCNYYSAFREKLFYTRCSLKLGGSPGSHQ